MSNLSGRQTGERVSYLIWKFLHVLSAIVFVGNITTGVFWAAHAAASRDLRTVATTFEGITRSDRWFTAPGVIGLTVSGIAAALAGGLPILGTGWILWGIVLFLVSGAAFGMRVAPLQREIVRAARAGDGGESSWAAFEKLYGSWKLWGGVALAAPLVAVVVMVLKPRLPAF